MYLIDTSVWIDYFRNKENSATRIFVDILDNKIPFGITGIIYQEILQGSATIKEFNKLSVYLGTQEFFYPEDEVRTHQAAAQLYFNCRRKGYTIRSSIDCFIAQIAIENKIVLLHNDADYLLIKKANPSLKLYI